MTAPVVTALDIAQVTIPSLSLLHTLIFFVPSAVRILFHIRLRKMTRLHLLQLTITFSILIIQLLYTFETSCHLAIVLESFSFLNFRDNGRLLDPISALGVMTLYVIALCSLVKYIIIKYESLVPPPNANIVIEHNRLCAVFKPSNVGHITLAIAVITGCMVVVAFGMSSFVSISSENLVAKIARVFSTIAFNGFCALVGAVLEIRVGLMILTDHQRKLMLQKKTITPRNTNIIKAHQLNTWNSAVTSNIQICRNSSARDVSQYGRQQELTSPDTFTTSDSSIYSDVSNRHKALKRMQHRISFLESFKLFGTIFIILGFAGLAFTLYFIGEFVTPATSFNSLLTIAMSAVLNGVLQTLRLINILHKALNNISDAANGVGLTKFEMKLGLATSAATPSEIHHKS